MAESKSYSFYVPTGDDQLNEFISAQSNLSLTIRLALKGLMYNYSGSYPDVSMMDLKSLIGGTNLTPERLAELEKEEKDRKQAGKRQQEAAIGQAPEEKAGTEPENEAESPAISNTDITQDVEQGSDEVISFDDEDDEDSEDLDESGSTGNGNDEIIDMDSLMGDTEDPEPKPEAKPEPKPEFKPEIKPEPKPKSKPDVKPEVKPEPKPESKPESKPEFKPEFKPEIKEGPIEKDVRAAYNAQQSSNMKRAEMDDIMSLMGDA